MIIKIKLTVRQDSIDGRKYHVDLIKGALTFRNAHNNKDLGPGQWISERDAQCIADRPSIYDVMVVPEKCN